MKNKISILGSNSFIGRAIKKEIKSKYKINFYNRNNLAYTYKRFRNKNSINKLIPFLQNDKKNNDDKINFILLKSIGKTALPNSSKISVNKLKKLTASISQY